MQRRYIERIPKLKGLSCGSRIAFIRQLRGMTQQELGLAIGLENDKIRNRICRYEKGGRIPKKDKIEKIAKALDVSEGMIRAYDFRNPSDFLYEMFWVEELMPDFVFALRKRFNPEEETTLYFTRAYRDWRKEQIKLEKDLISRREYIEWKLNYELEWKGGDNDE